MDIYFIRHAESEHNAGVSDSKDSPLTNLGKEQARHAAKRLEEFEVDSLYCSPQVRALQTADILGRQLNLRPKVCIGLAERCFCWEENGLSRSEMKDRFPRHILPPEVDEKGWARHVSYESDEELFRRVAPIAAYFRELAKQGEKRSIACVIHGGSGNSILQHLLLNGFSKIVRFVHSNCGLTHLKLEGQNIRLVFLNDTAHLSRPAPIRSRA